MLLPHMVVKGKVGSIPVHFYCLSLHIKSIEIACGISDVWAGSMYWLSSKWSEQIWYELYNCFAVFEPRSPGLVCMTHFLDLLRCWSKNCFAHFSIHSFHFTFIMISIKIWRKTKFPRFVSMEMAAIFDFRALTKVHITLKRLLQMQRKVAHK